MQILQLIVDGMSLGGLFAISALGIGMLYGVLQLINFAHGDFITLGAYLLVVPSVSVVSTLMFGGLPWPLLVVAVIAALVFFVLVAEYAVFRPLRHADPATLMIGSFALGYVIQNLVLMFYSGRPKSINLWPQLNNVIEFAGLRMPILQIVTIAATTLLLILLVLFLKRTSFGIALRAASEDFDMARLLGVKANTVIAVAFAISGLLAAVISLLVVTQVGVLSVNMGVPFMLYAFIATVIGGMGSLSGAVIGGFLLGFLSVLLQTFLPLEMRAARDAFVFAIVIAVLLWRPNGIVSSDAFRERV